MNTTSFPRIAVLALALGVAGLSATFAGTKTSDGTNVSTSSTSTKPSRHDSVLTADQREQLRKDYQQALSSNADLKTAMDNLRQQEKALHEQAKSLRDKIHAAMIAHDSSVQSILNKMAGTHKRNV